MKKIFLFILSLLFLTSCSLGSIFNTGGIYQNINFDEYSIIDYGNLQKVSFLESTGNRKVLVVPILFKDHKMTELEIQKMENDVNLAFFGDSEEIEFESVSSYYYKSSYGKLNITGNVSETVIIDKSVTEIVNLTKEDNVYKGIDEEYYDNSFYPINYAIDYLRDKIDLKEYDLNKDGRLDSIWFIYGEEIYSNYCNKNNILQTDEIYSKLKNFLWAFTYYYQGEKDINRPSINSYSFASYQFMYANENNIDSHIYIHEMGHQFGLKDYYNYDFGLENSSGVKDYSMPIGGLDMMDLNIGDHCAYSKFLLNWIKPTVVYGKLTYTLKTISKYDDAILIPISSLTNSPFSSYILIEYYTPDVLNYYDSINNFKKVYPNMFNEKGFRIYRVNSRLGSPLDEMKFIDDFSSIDEISTYIDFVTSNTPSKSMMKKYGYEKAFNDRLLTLLTPKDNSYFLVDDTYRFANNEDLFEEEDKFVYSENNVSIEISFSNLLEEEGTLHIEVKA